MALLKITLKTNESQDQLESDALSAAGNPQRQAEKLKNYIRKLQAGSTHGQIDVNVDPVKATGTLTLDTVVEDDTCVVAGVTLTAKNTPATNVQFAAESSDAPAQATGTLTLSSTVEDETCVVNGVTFTAKDAPAAGSLVQFEVGANDTETAANLAALVSAHPTLSPVLSATSALGVVTITANAFDATGNAITIVGDTTITASGATLSGGTIGTAARLAAAINAHPVLSLYVSATSAAAVVTLTAVEYGVTANSIGLTGDTTITRSAATLTGGTLGTVRSSVFGKAVS